MPDSPLYQLSREMLPAVEQELEQVIDRNITATLPELRGMLAYHLGWEGEGAGPEARGKRIRPLLTLLSAHASGGDWRIALPAAAAVELIHNFSLLHDDIQDESPTRHGRPTVWKRWGVAQAINAGDSMFTLAYLAIHRLGETVSPLIAFEAMGILQQACLKLTEGQYLDLSYEKRTDLGEADYWLMVAGKTAALLAACTELGSLAGGARPENRACFAEFGRCLGLAFQAQDDWLGLWGDAALTGKSTESDLVSGKKTLPVLIGLGKQGAFARRWVAGPVAPGEVAVVARLLAEEGASDLTLQATYGYTQQALGALDRAGTQSETQALRDLASRLLGRSA